MGKGDKKTKRGKLVNGSYGVRRPKKSKKAEQAIVELKEPELLVVEEKAPKKTAAKKEAKPKAEKKVAAKSSKKPKEEKSA